MTAPPPGGTVITGLSPASATPGGAAFTLTVNGSGFISGDTVKWAGTALTTTFVNATQLTAAVPANLIVAWRAALPLPWSRRPAWCRTHRRSRSARQAPATHLSVTAPATAGSGASFNVTVTALNASNQPATTFSGPVHFTSSDPSATLPADTTLNGTGTFSATLATAGTQDNHRHGPSALDFRYKRETSPWPRTSGSRFCSTQSPCRVVDTRTAAAPLGGPFVTGGGSRDFPIPSSSCGISRDRPGIFAEPDRSAEGHARIRDHVANGPDSARCIDAQLPRRTR